MTFFTNILNIKMLNALLIAVLCFNSVYIILDNLEFDSFEIVDAIDDGSNSDKEIEEITEKHIRLMKEESDLLITYHEKFKEVLPISKVMKIYIAEEQYKTFLLRQLRNRRENQGR
jgi:hypothetical protein